MKIINSILALLLICASPIIFAGHAYGHNKHHHGHAYGHYKQHHGHAYGHHKHHRHHRHHGYYRY